MFLQNCGAKVLIFCKMRNLWLSCNVTFNIFYPNKLNVLVSLLYFCNSDETFQ